MNYADRISNQMTIYYSQGKYNPRSSKRLSPADDEFFPKLTQNKGETSANEWVARTHSEPSRDSITAAITEHAHRNPARSYSGEDRSDRNKNFYLGKPAIFFQQSQIDSQADKFKFCLVGKFPQLRPSLSQIRNWVSTKWRLEGHCSVTLLDHRHVFIRLDNEKDMIYVWTRNRWIIGGHLMKVFKWFPTFVPSDGEPSSAAVWVSLPSLPLVFFQEELLFPIASLAGKVIGVDDPTRELSRTNVARVCVEVDLLKEPPRQIWVGIGEGGFWQDMCYQRFPPYCSNCRAQGHASTVCEDNRKSNHDTGTWMLNSKTCSGINRESSRPEDFSDRAKRVRISTIVEGAEGSKYPPRLGSLRAEKEKGKEIVKAESDSLSDDSSRRYSYYETLRAESSLAATEPNLSAEKSNGTKDVEIYGSGKSGCPLSSRQKFFKSRLMLFRGRSKQKDFIPPALSFSLVERFKYSEIKKMAKFEDKLGQSCFGTVFRGKFHDGQEVAVSVLNQTSFDGDEEFIRELRILTSASHANIIRLLGFCFEGSKRVLVYELMKSDLASIISSKASVIKSQQLIEIAVGIARGVEYLHQELDSPSPCLLVEPSSILLDEEFRPKLCNFVLAQASTSLGKPACGTVGYISPEYVNEGGVSRIAEVYSYGITLLEMSLRRKATNSQVEIPPDVCIHKWVRRRVAAMGGIQGFALDEIDRKMVIVGVWCTQENPALRPSFTSVIDMLQARADDLYFPPLLDNGNELGTIDSSPC